MIRNDLIGTRISVRRRNHERVEGWYVHASSIGVYLSLDPFGENVILIPEPQWSYSMLDTPRTNFPPEFMKRVEGIDAFTQALESEFNLALRRVDHNQIARVADRIGAARSDLKTYYDYRIRQEPVPVHTLVAIIQSHAALTDEVIKSGIGDFLVKHIDQVRFVLSLDTLPLIDQSVVEREILTGFVENSKREDHLQSTGLGQDLIARYSASELHELSRAVSPPKKQDKNKNHRLLRFLSAWVKIASGSALAAANIGVGALIGLSPIMHSVNMTAVSALLAVPLSTYTGLNAAADGLEKLADAYENADKNQSAKEGQTP